RHGCSGRPPRIPPLAGKKSPRGEVAERGDEPERHGRGSGRDGIGGMRRVEKNQAVHIDHIEGAAHALIRPEHDRAGDRRMPEAQRMAEFVECYCLDVDVSTVSSPRDPARGGRVQYNVRIEQLPGDPVKGRGRNARNKTVPRIAPGDGVDAVESWSKRGLAAE